MALPNVTVEAALTTNPTESATWTDLSSRVRGFSVRRGRQHELDKFQAGTGTIWLDNRDRHLDPTYAAGPHFGKLLPMRRLRIRTTLGRGFPIFSGYVEAWPQQWPAKNDAIVPVRVVDGFKILAMRKLNTSYSQERTDERINNVLDDASWTLGNSWVLDSSVNSLLGTTTILGPNGDRLIGEGASTVQASALSDTLALAHIQEVEESENGRFFIDAEGNAVFVGRREVTGLKFIQVFSVWGDSEAAGENIYTDLELAYDESRIWNEVRVTRVGGAVQVATDATSQARYFPRTLTRAPLILTDSEANDAANWLLGRYREPGVRVVSMTVHPERGDPAGTPNIMWERTLRLELGDRITVKRRPPGGGDPIEQDSFVEGIEHDARGHPRNWSVTFRLSPADNTIYWVLDSSVASQLGETTKLAY